MISSQVEVVQEKVTFRKSKTCTIRQPSWKVAYVTNHYISEQVHKEQPFVGRKASVLYVYYLAQCPTLLGFECHVNRTD